VFSFDDTPSVFFTSGTNGGHRENKGEGQRNSSAPLKGAILGGKTNENTKEAVDEGGPEYFGKTSKWSKI